MKTPATMPRPSLPEFVIPSSTCLNLTGLHAV